MGVRWTGDEGIFIYREAFIRFLSSDIPFCIYSLSQYRPVGGLGASRKHLMPSKVQAHFCSIFNAKVYIIYNTTTAICSQQIRMMGYGRCRQSAELLITKRGRMNLDRGDPLLRGPVATLSSFCSCSFIKASCSFSVRSYISILLFSFLFFSSPFQHTFSPFSIFLSVYPSCCN